MAGAKDIFNALYDTFQATEFFQDAIYPFTWTESISSGIDRNTGSSTTVDTVYSSNSFLLNPSKSERPSASVFKNIKAGDIAISVQQNELIKAPTLDADVTFNSKAYTCKEIVSDTVGVSWKFLLRN